MDNPVRVATISDLHGSLPDPVDADLCVIAGDIGPSTPLYHADPNYAEDWLKEHFNDWLRSWNCPVAGLGGNHDFVFQWRPEVPESLDWAYLYHQPATVAGVSLWGSPWTPTFFDWAFMAPDEELEAFWSRIPPKVDLLATHGPPRGILDINSADVSCGSVSMKRWIDKALPDALPQHHIFGHIHNPGGQSVRYRDTLFHNVACKDDRLRVRRGYKMLKIVPGAS